MNGTTYLAVQKKVHPLDRASAPNTVQYLKIAYILLYHYTSFEDDLH
uniref:Uncharacterized protein n=1 Tax=Arundo donax TaxID=35708 RepID=A0A0A9AXN1_ARUDO